MAIETASSLVETVRDLGLLDPAQSDLLADLAGRYSAPRDLGRHLIQIEWLTAFQVNQLLQGRGRQLVFGPYALLERIGAGGMSEVFKARHRKLLRIAAVKVVSRQRLDHPVALRRFLREAEAAARLAHPHIVAVHDAGEQGDHYYLAMEYIDGIDLARLVHQAGPLPVALACDFIRQAAVGLQHAHAQGFVHRDIKPQNLLAAPRGGMGRPEARALAPGAFDRFAGATVKVLDMGLVHRSYDGIEDAELALTQKGMVLGTMDYLAPEQARNSHRVDARADLYGLGCTLYHLLAGRPPFPGGLPFDKLMRHQMETPAALRGVRAGVPADLEAVVARLMAKQPEDRPATAAEVALALVPFCGAGPLEGVATPVPDGLVPAEAEPKADPAGSEPDLPSPLVRRRRRAAAVRSRRWWWLGGGAAALLGLLVLALVAGATRKQDPAPTPETKKIPPPRVDHLATYVPTDTVGVAGLWPRELREASIFRNIGSQGLAFDSGLRELFDRIGVDLTRDTDEVRFFLPAQAPEQSTWLARGRFESAAFRPGDGFELLTTEKARGKLVRYQATDSPDLFVAAHGKYLLGGARRARIEVAQDHAAAGKAAPPADAEMRRLLAAVDRKQSLWLAVVPPRFDGPPPLGEPGMQPTVDHLFPRSASIQGGIRCGRELEARFFLVAHNERAALEVLGHLHSIKRLAASAVKRNTPAERRLWLLLLGNAVLTRKGLGIEARSIVRAEMLN